MRTTFLAFALLGLIFGGVSGTALAAPGTTVEATIVTRDLDVTSKEGRATFARRLSITAAELCGEPSAIDREGRNAVRACRAEVIAQAERAFANRAMTAARLAAR